RWGLPVKAQPFDPAVLMNIMFQDKKARAFGLQWVLLKDIGRPAVVRNVDKDLVTEAFNVIQENPKD
ncbi:MAG TPA: 3-dehydroquinate synthase, partial [Sulfobacillus sp.]|nr:3-dehydroquinate synthase [Sulfobacillus sp.]